MNISRISVSLVLFLFLSSCLIYALDDVTFNYQGRIKVQGLPFTGSGLFKFAIVNDSGTQSLWSNDNTSIAGGEPLASISITVIDGVFNVMIGDTDLGMYVINRSIFNYPNQIYLRIWFNDGIHGFQQLLPDHELVNIELLGIISGTTDFTIYVNGTTGKDEYNGLSPSRAKKTIQAAVDVLAERPQCTITIDIADGIYRESVMVSGIDPKPGNYLIFQGDETWTPSSVGDPSVRITGTDNDITHTRVRDNVFYITDCVNVQVKGILFDYGNKTGMTIWNGHNYGYNCKAAHNGEFGFRVSTNARGHFYDCLAYNNVDSGFLTSYNSICHLWDCISNNNGNAGVFIDSLSKVSCFGTGDFSYNTNYGVKAITLSCIQFLDYGSIIYSGTITNNGQKGLYLRWDCHSLNHTKNTLSNNGGGSTDNIYTVDGSNTY